MNSFCSYKKLEITHFETKHYIKDLTLKELPNDKLQQKKFHLLISYCVGKVAMPFCKIFVMDCFLLFLFYYILFVIWHTYISFLFKCNNRNHSYFLNFLFRLSQLKQFIQSMKLRIQRKYLLEPQNMFLLVLLHPFLFHLLSTFEFK